MVCHGYLRMSISSRSHPLMHRVCQALRHNERKGRSPFQHIGKRALTGIVHMAECPAAGCFVLQANKQGPRNSLLASNTPPKTRGRHVIRGRGNVPLTGHPFAIHRASCALLAALVGLHGLAAIEHQVIRSNNVLRRML